MLPAKRREISGEVGCAGGFRGRRRPRVPGRLRARRVKPATLERYEAAYNRFLDWLELSNRHWDVDRGDVIELDACCEDFIDWLYHNEISSTFPLSWAKDFGCAVQYFHPFLRRHLPCTWLAIGVWEREEPVRRAPPLPADCLLAAVALAYASEEWHFACAILLMFHAYLRPSELFALSISDVRFFKRGASRGIVALHPTKTSVRKGISEYVALDDPLVLMLLQDLLRRFGRERRIWPWSKTAFRARFNAYMCALDLAELSFRPYSLRRGGASHDFRLTACLDRILLRGRWASVAAARLYIQDAQAAAVRLNLSPLASSFVASSSAGFRRLWRQVGVGGMPAVLS